MIRGARVVKFLIPQVNSRTETDENIQEGWQIPVYSIFFLPRNTSIWGRFFLLFILGSSKATRVKIFSSILLRWLVIHMTLLYAQNLLRKAAWPIIVWDDLVRNAGADSLSRAQDLIPNNLSEIISIMPLGGKSSSMDIPFQMVTILL